jgi:hypothetical protein
MPKGIYTIEISKFRKDAIKTQVAYEIICEELALDKSYVYVGGIYSINCMLPL